ncbi:MAG: right-handed parallel beta-helix repeat-containing protein [Syntrophobacteraceae bacterium]|nr:right-handed parallel beta-helix repeat-containing protein [Syntrophobacteraceae bacterium]
MKGKQIAILSIATLAAALFAGGAYCFWGGQEPSKNMGNFRSFSFYADRAGYAATQWMQPGTAPASPWNEFWFDPNGNFNVAAGINVPGPVAIGLNSTTANNLAQLTADANFAGTVYLTAPVTLTANLTTTCDLRPLNGAVISAPVTACVSGAVASTPSGVVGQGTVTASGTRLILSNNTDFCNLYAPGATITSGGTTVTVTAMLGNNTFGDPYPDGVTVNTAQSWSGASFTYAPMSPLVTIGDSSHLTDYNNIQVGSILTANGQSVVVLAKNGNYTVTVSGAVNWSAGCSFTYTTVSITINGPFHAGNYQCFSHLPATFALNSTKDLNATWFGVIPDSDGTHGNGTDNCAPLATALESSIISGVPLHLPQGIMRLAHGFYHIYISSSQVLRLFGDGESKCEIFCDYDDTEPGVYFLASNSQANVHDFSIHRYNTGVTNGGQTLGFEGFQNFDIHNLDISGANGWNFLTVNCSYGSIHDCKIHDSSDSYSTDGIHLLPGCSNITIHDNKVWNLGDDGIVLFSDISGSPITNIVVTNNVVFENNTRQHWGNGIKVGQGAQHVVVANNIVHDVDYAIVVDIGDIGNPSGTGFGGQNDVCDVNIHDNIIYGTSSIHEPTYGIAVVVFSATPGYTIHDITISKNRVSMCLEGIGTFLGNGVPTEFISNIDIVGNVISNITNGSGILAQFVNNLTISDNLISNTVLDGINVSVSTGRITIKDNRVDNWNMGEVNGVGPRPAITYNNTGGLPTYFTSAGTASTGGSSQAVTLSSAADYANLAAGTGITVGGTTVYVTQLIASPTTAPSGPNIEVSSAVTWTSASFTYSSAIVVTGNILENPMGQAGSNPLYGFYLSGCSIPSWVGNNVITVPGMANPLPAAGTYISNPWNVFPATVTGTSAGSCTWTEPNQGISDKKLALNFNGYENTSSTPQTITLPTGFTGTIAAYGSCPVNGFAVSGSTVTLPYGMSSAFSGNCFVEGQ